MPQPPVNYFKRCRALIKRRLQTANRTAKAKGYSPPTTPFEKVVSLWYQQEGYCASCEIDIGLESCTFGCCLDHDHETGEVRGFICNSCNVAEGMLKDYTEDQFYRFCEYRRSCLS